MEEVQQRTSNKLLICNALFCNFATIAQRQSYALVMRGSGVQIPLVALISITVFCCFGNQHSRHGFYIKCGRDIDASQQRIRLPPVKDGWLPANLRVSFNGRMRPLQGLDVSSILITRSDETTPSAMYRIHALRKKLPNKRRVNNRIGRVGIQGLINCWNVGVVQLCGVTGQHAARKRRTGSNPCVTTKIRNPYSKTILRTFTFTEIILKWVLTNTLCGSGNLPANREEPVRHMD